MIHSAGREMLLREKGQGRSWVGKEPVSDRNPGVNRALLGKQIVWRLATPVRRE